MSLAYFAISVRDHSQLGPLIEGGESDAPAIDAEALLTNLSTRHPNMQRKGRALRWEKGADYFSLVITERCVEVTLNPSDSEVQMDLLIDVFDDLKSAELHIWDPQKGDWFP